MNRMKISFPESAPFECDSYRIIYGQVSGTVLSLTDKARNVMVKSLADSRKMVAEAYDLLFEYSNSGYQPNSKMIRGLLNRINSVERIMEAAK